MSIKKIENMLKGIIPPMVTPLSGQDNIDSEGLERLVEHILSGGVHGLFILGTTGEAPNLSYTLRYDLIKRVCKQVNNRVPIYVGITDTSFTESVKLSQFAYEQGVDAVVVAPPYYLPVGQQELIEYIEHLANEIPLPAVLYNMPGCTKVMIDPETVLRMSEIPGIIGLKDSSADMLYFNKVKFLLKDNPTFRLLIGPEELLAESLTIGGEGGVSGGANMFPRLYVDLYNAAIASDVDKVRELHQIIVNVSSRIYCTGKYSSAVVKGIKCALKLMGVCDDFVAEPFHRFREPERILINKHLESLSEMYGSKYFDLTKKNCNILSNETIVSYSDKKLSENVRQARKIVDNA